MRMVFSPGFDDEGLEFTPALRWLRVHARQADTRNSGMLVQLVGVADLDEEVAAKDCHILGDDRIGRR